MKKDNAPKPRPKFPLITLKLVVCLAIGLVALSGCSREAEETPIPDYYPVSYDDYTSQDNDSGEAETEITSGLANHFAPIEDTVVATINGMNVYERNVLFEINRAKGPILWEYFEVFSEEWDEDTTAAFINMLMTGEIDSDLISSESELSGGVTFDRAVLELAAVTAAELIIYTEYAQAIGVEVTDVSISEINFYIDNLIWEHGQESFDALLLEDRIMGTSHLAEIFRDHWILDNLVFRLMTEPEEFAPFEGYMVICDAEERATAILERLHAGEDFVTLMDMYGEDPGMPLFPDGYTFVAGQMVESFHEGTLALEIGEISGLVESNHGFHIILRVEPDPDNIMHGVEAAPEELLGAKHILILTDDAPLDERMLDAIFGGFEAKKNAADIEFLPALWDIDVWG